MVKQTSAVTHPRLENSQQNEKLNAQPRGLSLRSGGWQISAIPRRTISRLDTTIDNLSAREMQQHRREFIAHRQSRGLIKVHL